MSTEELKGKATEEAAGDVKWERWQKKSIFVREVASKYGQVYRQLLEQPRGYSNGGWSDSARRFFS